MTADLVIRVANAGDASRIAGLHVRSWLTAYRPFAPAAYLASLDQDAHRLGYWQPRLEQAAEGSRAWVAYAGGIPAGFANVERSTDQRPPWERVPEGHGWIYHIHLAPEFHGRGVGSALFRHALAHLRAEGFERAALWVYEENALARQFYEWMGWVTDGAAEEKPLSWTGPDGVSASATLTMVRYVGPTSA